MKTILLVTASLFFYTACSSSSKSNQSSAEENAQDFPLIEMEYGYKQLKLLDVDQMVAILNDKNRQFQKTGDLQRLREGVMVAFSRPDEDRLRDKVISVVRNPLEDQDNWDKTMNALADQAIKNLFNEALKSEYQVTSGIILENVIADLRPAFIREYKTGGFATDIIEKIAASNVEYSKEARQERKLYLMRNDSPPSQIAKNLMDRKSEILKKEKK